MLKLYRAPFKRKNLSICHLTASIFPVNADAFTKSSVSLARNWHIKVIKTKVFRLYSL